MPLFRFHRGQLKDSLKTTIIVKDTRELMDIIRAEHEKVWGNRPEKIWGIMISPIPDEETCFDERCGWYTQIVTSDWFEKGIHKPEGYLSEPL